MGKYDPGTGPGLMTIAQDRLDAILEDHVLWLDSRGRKGSQADLAGVSLAAADLAGRNLDFALLKDADLSGATGAEATFRHAVLTNARLDNAQLSGAGLEFANCANACFKGARLDQSSLRGADLSRADMTGAFLKDTDLRETVLRDADLTGASSLLGEQLAMADVTHAALPGGIAGFDGLETVKEASQNARKLFFGMLLACAYTALTVATTDDLKLLTNSASSPMPIIGSRIPIVFFYYTAPVLLMGLYAYLHLYQQRLWEGLAKLPAVFPDGRHLNEKAYPWLMNGLVSRHLLRLRPHRPRLSGLQTVLSVLLSWWSVPATLFWIWLRYLRRHDIFWSVMHAAMLSATVWAGLLFYRVTVTTFTLGEPDRRRLPGLVLVPVSIGSLLLFLSIGGIHHSPSFVPRLFETIGYSPNVRLTEAEISIPPTSFDRENPDHLKFVRGASLAGANLRNALLSGAFLAKADLRGADLRDADLIGANLMGARLEGGDLRRADLSDARLSWQSTASGTAAYDWDAALEDVDLSDADLSRATLPADLRGVRMQRARIRDADLRGIDFSSADLQGVDFTRSRLSRSLMNGADLSGARMSRADLSSVDLGQARLIRVDFTGARIQSTNFAGADLAGAKGFTVEQLKGSSKNAHRAWPARNIMLARCGENLLTLLGLPADHGVRLTARNFDEYSLVRVDLYGADLQRASFRGADLTGADLGAADLRHADLRLAVLDHARLGGTDLRGADLRQVSLINMRWSTGTRLELANIHGAKGMSASVREDLIERGAVSIEDDGTWQGMKTVRQTGG